MMQEPELCPFVPTPLPHAEGPWLVLAPHPDDESFGMGGSLLKARTAGIATHVLIMTDGALGGAAPDIVALRQRETRAAADLLGLSGLHFLGQPDRALGLGEPVVAQLLALVETLRPAALFFPGVWEMHPDHRRTALLAWQVLQRLGSRAPVGIAYEITGQSPANLLVDISAQMAGKLAALRAYGSQLQENNYLDIVQALNKLRTLTLGPQVDWAETYYRFSAAELHGSLSAWIQSRVAAMLAH